MKKVTKLKGLSLKRTTFTLASEPARASEFGVVLVGARPPGAPGQADSVTATFHFQV